MPMNRTFMTNRGLAYIWFETPAAADKAISHMHEGQLDGAQISMQEYHLGREVVDDTGHPYADARRLGEDMEHESKTEELLQKSQPESFEGEKLFAESTTKAKNIQSTKRGEA
ncbi:putative nucleic acid binding protein 7 [Elsinoe australis]|uniref:Putative nucleic acid binding protein 7 n=1 Tax=Elsinoe australis TaxID=40998 RepID=A0A4U7B4P3_9PEZI|nr:putative nucleic acid binding protein 7 [Elsinoe australis]